MSEQLNNAEYLAFNKDTSTTSWDSLSTVTSSDGVVVRKQLLLFFAPVSPEDGSDAKTVGKYLSAIFDRYKETAVVILCCTDEILSDPSTYDLDVIAKSMQWPAIVGFDSIVAVKDTYCAQLGIPTGELTIPTLALCTADGDGIYSVVDAKPVEVSESGAVFTESAMLMLCPNPSG